MIQNPKKNNSDGKFTLSVTSLSNNILSPTTSSWSHSYPFYISLLQVWANPLITVVELFLGEVARSLYRKTNKKITILLFSEVRMKSCNLSIIHGEISAFIISLRIIENCTFSPWIHKKSHGAFLIFFLWLLGESIFFLKRDQQYASLLL